MARAAAAATLAAAMLACGGKPARPRHDGGDAGAGVRGGAAGAASTDGAGTAAAPTTPDGAAPPYRLAPLGGGDVVVGGGTIAVTVTWPAAPASVRRSPGVTACATTRPARATIGALHGVAGVVVLVDGIETGKRPPAASPVRLTVRDCAVAPAVAVQPRIGATLEVQAQDDAIHAIAVADLGPAWKSDEVTDAAAVTRAHLPAWGHTVALPLPAAGVRRVVADAAEDAAYVVVTGHPYAAVTGDDGAAALEQVPAGTHAIVAWLPPAPGHAAMIARGTATVVAGDKVEITLRLGT